MLYTHDVFCGIQPYINELNTFNTSLQTHTPWNTQNSL